MLAHGQHDEAMPNGMTMAPHRVELTPYTRRQKPFRAMGRIEHEAEDIGEEGGKDGGDEVVGFTRTVRVGEGDHGCESTKGHRDEECDSVELEVKGLALVSDEPTRRAEDKLTRYWCMLNHFMKGNTLPMIPIAVHTPKNTLA